MKVIRKEYQPHKTGLVSRVTEAKRKGKKAITLKTAVDVYGAFNLQTHLTKCIAPVSVRRNGSEVKLLINPNRRGPGRSTVKSRAGNLKIREAIYSLGDGDCLLLTTPIETLRFKMVEATLRRQGHKVRSMRNCQNVMVWKA